MFVLDQQALTSLTPTVQLLRLVHHVVLMFPEPGAKNQNLLWPAGHNTHLSKVAGDSSHGLTQSCGGGELRGRSQPWERNRKEEVSRSACLVCVCVYV